MLGIFEALLRWQGCPMHEHSSSPSSPSSSSSSCSSSSSPYASVSSGGGLGGGSEREGKEPRQYARNSAGELVYIPATLRGAISTPYRIETIDASHKLSHLFPFAGNDLLLYRRFVAGKSHKVPASPLLNSCVFSKASVWWRTATLMRMQAPA